MKQKITVIIAFLLSISGFTACKKNTKHDEPVPETVIIDIKSPKPGQEYGPGDTVVLDIRISSGNDLHGYGLHAMSLADTSQVLSLGKHLHEKEINIRETYVNTMHVHSDIELAVSALIDHNGHSVRKVVRYHCRAQ